MKITKQLLKPMTFKEKCELMIKIIKGEIKVS